MLSLIVSGEEIYDEELNEFRSTPGYNLELEHSLVSLSKWESKYNKPFLSEEQKTPIEMYDYIKFMAIHPGVPEHVFLSLNDSDLARIVEYMNEKQTATWFNEPPNQSPMRTAITSELIYYWISALGLDASVVENWHLNRLFTVLKVASIEGQPKKKKSRTEVLAEIRRKNAERRAKYEKEGAPA